MIAVVTPDVVGKRMAGPGIRSYHFAREISRRFDVALVASFHDLDALPLEGIRLVDFGSSEARGILESARVVIGQPHRETLRLRPRENSVVFDLFDPVVLELAESGGGVRARAHRFLESRRLTAALDSGGPIIAATEKQKELYERIAVRKGISIDDESWLIIPFGIPEDDPPVVEKASPPLVIWNGGVWPWLDPLTAVRAIEEVNRRGLSVRLSFMGTGRPNPEVTGALPVLESISKSEDVDWNPDWIPYGERASVLGAASISVMLHGATEEAEYSIRTRLFDAIWCGIPIVATKGGFAADLVEREGLGIVVPPGDVARVADAIATLLLDDALRSRSVSAFEGLRARFLWREVCKPLLDAIDELLQ